MSFLCIFIENNWKNGIFCQSFTFLTNFKEIVKFHIKSIEKSDFLAIFAKELPF